MTRPIPAEAGTDGLGSQGQTTPHHRPQGAYLRLHGDAETMAADLIERIGPAAALALAGEIITLTSSPANPGVQVVQIAPPGHQRPIPAGKILGLDGKLYPSSRTSTSDRRHQVSTCLAEHPGCSDRAAARALGMSPSTVGPIRRQVRAVTQ